MTKLIKLVFPILIIGSPNFLTACATCYGAPDAPATQGLNMAILVLLAFTGSVLSSIVIASFSLYKRSKSYQLRLSNTDDN